ncbi:MAG: V-type ATP synthase subunit C [Candidatus Oleimmundimicrobium sp.]|nr:V-type ATP synthase subunit C [Candidatus Oleimmundimicrobium sp.]
MNALRDPLKYGFAVGRIKVRETKMLGSNRLDRLINADDFADQKRILAETDYANFFQEAKTPEDVEESLDNYLAVLYEFLEEVYPDKQILSYFRSRYDFHNLKVLLKAKYEGKPIERIWSKLGMLEIEKIKKAIEESELEEIIEPYRSALYEAMERFEQDRDFQQIDIVLDKALYRYLYEVARKQKNKFFIGFVRSLIDLVNLKVFLRAKILNREPKFIEDAFLNKGYLEKEKLVSIYHDTLSIVADKLKETPYAAILQESMVGQEFNLDLFDKKVDDFLIHYIQPVKYIPVGLEPLISYIMAKENEVKSLRIILIGKLSGLSAQTIKERVRVQYV